MKKLLLIIIATAFFLFTWTFAVKSAVLNVPEQYATIKLAVAAATSGDIIQVGTATIIESENVDISKPNLTIQGNGAENSFVQVSGTGYRFSILATNVTIKDLSIKKADKDGVQNIIWINANNFTLQNTIISGQFVFGDNEVSRAMEISGGHSGLVIDGNTFYALRQPAYINGTITGTISNNHTYGTKGWVVAGGNLIFTNNTWGVNVFDIAIISDCPNVYYSDIPAMSNANHDAVIEDQRVSPRVLSVVHVDASTSYNSDLGGQYHPYSTITPAITRVVSGGKIKVAPGTYHEQINISKAITVSGANQATTIIDGAGISTAGLVHFTNTTGSATFQGFTVQNAPIVGNRSCCIYACDLSSGVIVNILNNTLKGKQNWTLIDDIAIACQNNLGTIRLGYNTVSGFAGNTILLERSLGPVEIDHNMLTAWQPVGEWGVPVIYDMNYRTSTETDPHNLTAIHSFHDNTIDGGGGITVVSCWGTQYNDPSFADGKVSNLQIRNNIISNVGTDHRYIGIALTSNGETGGFTNTLIEGNTITAKNPGSVQNIGIRMYANATDVDITGNTITNFWRGIYQTNNSVNPPHGNPTGLHVYHNQIFGGTHSVYNDYTDVANIINAENNYFGTISAADIAAKCSANVDYDPWCNADFSVCSFTNTPSSIYNQTQQVYLATLQDALNGAVNGDVINITAGGTYAGVVFNRPGISVTVNNTSGSTVLIQGASPALTVTSGTVTYDNVSFITATNDPTILVDGGNLTLRNCTITESTGFSNTGILVSSGTLDAGTACGTDAGNNTFITDNGKNITQTGGTADAKGNYWGNTGYFEVLSKLSGVVTFDPYRNSTFSECLSTSGGPVTYASKVVLAPGTVTVPITVDNFNHIDAVSLVLKYDPLVLDYTGFTNSAISGITIHDEPVTGTLSLAWYGSTGSGITLTDPTIDHKLVDLQFTSVTGTSTLSWDDNDPADTRCEYQNALIQYPYMDDPATSFYIDGWVTDLSLSFTRTYSSSQTITANVTGGASPYTYSWTGPGSSTFSGETITLIAGYGDYTVTVTDNVGASITRIYYFGPVHNMNTYVDYTTIQSGITAASDGHNLLVDAGTYQENITIDKAITLSGVDKTSTIIDGNNSGIVVKITVGGVTFENFTVQKSGLTGNDGGILLGTITGIGTGTGVSGCLIQNNILTNSVKGIALAFGSGNTVKWNTLSGNGDWSILLGASTNNILEANSISNNALSGIYLDNQSAFGGTVYSLGSTGNNITGNTISHIAGGESLNLGENCDYNNVTGNTIDGGSYGIHVWKSHHQTITNNTIKNCTIQPDGNHSAVAIRIRNGQDNTITGNTITENMKGFEIVAHEAPYCSGNVIQGNKIYGNGSGIDASPSNGNYTVIATNNWWGTPSGPAHSSNPCGTGNSVTDYVTFDPWYFQEGMTTINTLPVVTVTDIPDISTITSTPVIIPVTITYPVFSLNLEPSIKSDARISTTTPYPAGAKIIGISYTTGSVFIPITIPNGSYDLGGKTEVFLSQVVGTAFPLLGLSGKTVQWEITIVGIGASGTYASTGQAITWLTAPYGETSGCYSVLAAKSFNVTFADATFDATGTETTICYNSPLTFNATITFPPITNVNSAIKADNLITSTVALPAGTKIKWGYNAAPSVTYTLPSSAASIYLSDIVNAGTPLPLQGNTGPDTWYFEITDEGSPITTTITMQPVARLITAPGPSYTDYNYTAGDNLSMIVNTCGISGTVVYNNLYNTPMNNVTLTLTNGTTTPRTVITDANGSFSLPNVEDGTYTLGFSTLKPTGGINSTDAAQVNYWAVNPYSIEKARFFAGDVAAPKGFLNSSDASRIIEHFVTLGVPAFDTVWRFWKAGDMTSAISNSYKPTLTVDGGSVSQNFYALASGDFNRSFIPGNAKDASDNLSLTISGSKQVSQGDVFELPIYATSAMEVTAVSMILKIPATMLEVTGITLGPDPSAQVFHALHGNELRIGWQSLTPLSLQAGEPLLILKLRMTGSLEEGGQIRLTLAGDELNELADDAYEVIPGAELSVNLIGKAVGTDELPSAGKLSLSNYPNPFTEKTTFVYTLPVSGQVTLDIYNILGVKVKTLVCETQQAGTHAVIADGNFAESGVYIAIIHLEADGQEFKDMIKVVCSH